MAAHAYTKPIRWARNIHHTSVVDMTQRPRHSKFVLVPVFLSIGNVSRVVKIVTKAYQSIKMVSETRNLQFGETDPSIW